MATLTIPSTLSRVDGGVKVEVALDKQSTVSSILQQVQMKELGKDSLTLQAIQEAFLMYS